MIELVVRDTYLECSTNVDTKIDFDTFKELTGISIDFSIRTGKRIKLFREAGHLYIQDREFIAKGRYKNVDSRVVFKCIGVDKSGVALLSPAGKALKTFSTNIIELYTVVT
jgi:hypothetical protein